MLVITLLAAVVAISIGIVVLWANPSRGTNQVFALTALIVAVFLYFLCRAVNATSLYQQGHAQSAVPMLRVASTIGMFFPWMLWILKESLVQRRFKVGVAIRRSGPLFLLSVLGAGVCFTSTYIPLDASPHGITRGRGYIGLLLGMSGIYAFIAGQSLVQMRNQTGIRRMEIQFLVVNSALAALVVASASYCAYYWQMPALRRLIPIVIIAAYALAAWAFTYYRIVDVREICLSIIGRGVLVIALGLGVFVAYEEALRFLSPIFAIVVSVAGLVPLAFVLDRPILDWLGVSGKSALVDMRRAVIDIARSEPQPEKLVGEFERFLQEESHSRFATLLAEKDELFGTGAVEFSKARLGCGALADTGWATPESLLRRRSTPGLEDLQAFLSEHSLGLLVASPRGSSTPTLLIALGVKTNEWPFTYPEVERLQNVAELMDNILTRSRLTMQAALRAKVEHLAMMSRGLAHDLNNLITPVSSFLVHTDRQFPPESPEHVVHEAASRSVRVMGEYVREALFFSSNLTPKIEPVELGLIFREVRALTASRAVARGVKVGGEPEFTAPVLVDAVLIQRLLVNLVGNAIDASSSGHTVTLAAAAARPGWFRLEVSDTGHGIPPEILGRIFDPYFTTKQFGEQVRGFGLGLTICQKIVQLHNGNITVRSPPGAGTVISIDLPITPSN